MQARIIPISLALEDYATEVAQQMKRKGIRAEVMAGKQTGHKKPVLILPDSWAPVVQ